MALGLLLLRLVIGALLVGHGTQKLFGWFGGHGLDGVGGWFHSIGFRPGRSMAVMAGLGEAGGGLLLALGLLTPLAALALVGTLLVAASVHLPKLWATEGGGEYPVVLAVVGATFAFTGPGRYSLDNALGIHLDGVGYGVLVIALGVLSAVAVAGMARRNVASDAPVYPEETTAASETSRV
jgi:putative oxidoreductase